MESDDSDIELLSTQFVRPRAASSSQPVESSSSSRSSSSRKDKPKKTSAAATVSSSQKEVLEMLSDTDDAFEMPSSSSAPAPTAGKSKPQRKLVKKG